MWQTPPIAAAREVPGVDEDGNLAALIAQIERVMDQLTPKEQEVLRLRFGLGGGVPQTLDEVAQAFGVSPERVRQIQAKALRKVQSGGPGDGPGVA